MSFRDWWRRLLDGNIPESPIKLTKAEAVQRARAYAAANGYQVREPMDIQLKRQFRNHKEPQAGYRYVYIMALGTYRPGTFVEVDAGDGTVLSWHMLPR